MDDGLVYPGSRWWKFDFHVHTPESGDYDPSSKDVKPKEWLRKAMDAGLDCVVAADHNSGGWIDQLKAANEELRHLAPRPDWLRDLTIFPGVEITVADSCRRVHLLAVFDPECGGEKITAVLGACEITSGFGDDQATSTTTSFVDTVRKIEKAGGVAIPAHVDGPKGLLESASSLTPELRKSLDGVFAAEFCDLNKFNDAEPGLKGIVERLAKLAGSDAHAPADIGRHFSWLKMSRPSMGGLKLALLDHEFCVKNQDANPNGAPDIFLSGLTVESMRHCGRVEGSPFTLRFHPHFNAIIGGRGTGKSTVLEAIRIALRRDQELAAEAPRVKERLDRFMKHSRDKGVMLDDTEILAEVHRRSGDFRLRWRFDGAGAVLEEKHGSDWVASDAGDVKSRFPVSIYSQKQINELASNPRGLLAIVDRSPEVDRAEWAARWEMLKSRFLQMKERQRELSRQLSVEPDIRATLRDVERDLKLYEEKGSGDVLKQYQKRSQQKSGLSMDSVFDDLAAGMRKLAESAELPDFPSYLFDETDETAPEMQSVHEEAAKNLRQMALTLESLADTVEKWKSERHAQIEASRWGRVLQVSNDAYTALRKEYEEKKSPLSLSAYGEWVQQRGQLQRQLEGLESLRGELESLNGQIEEARENFVALRRELLEKRRDFLGKVIGSSPFVRMELVPFGDASALEEEYRNLLNLDGDKFGSSILDGDGGRGVLYDLRHWEDNKIPESELPRLISEMKSKTLDIAMGKDIGNHGKFDNRLRKLFENQPGAFDQLESWWPEDLLRVKYSKDPSSRKFDDLEKGSAGQKAAAILAFLLSHGAEPLVMDQPEDDLDNALIYDLIVKQMHENKNRRQLIVVTHNPNIVVNGDAELVHALEFERGQVRLQNQGGLEEQEIRDAVCTIMEGGREALTKRYRRMTLEV